jgi:tetratricopeptide (TPR) repeat protein
VLGLAELAAEEGELTRARSLAQAAAAVEASGASVMLAEISLAGRDYEGARRHIQAVLAKDELSQSAWLLLAKIEKEAGSLPAAWNALERVRQLENSSGSTPLPDFQFLSGDVLARMGRERETEAAFRLETSAFPDNPRGWTGLATLYASQGRPEKADSTLRDLVVRSPRPASYFAAARTYEILGDRAAAERLRKRASALFPGAREPRSAASVPPA